MAKPKLTFMETPNGLVNLKSIVGVIKVDAQLYGFNSSGSLSIYCDKTTPEVEIDEMHKSLSEHIGTKGVLKTPCGGGLPINIIGEVYVSPKTGSIVFSSVSSDKALLIIQSEQYSDIEGLYDAVKSAVIDMSNGRTGSVDWTAFAA